MTEAEDKNRQKWIDDFYKGLQVLDEYSFPKTCTNCGKTYQSIDDFISGTDGVNHPSGLTSFDARTEPVIVGLYRNCDCHSTLMGTFKDRRDTSEKGTQARAQFDKLLKMLKESGLPHKDARSELLQFLRGEPSSIPERLNNKEIPE